MASTEPRLCAIYLRDLLQFIKPTHITKFRQVSSRCDAVIGSTPEVQLPKRHYAANFRIYVSSAVALKLCEIVELQLHETDDPVTVPGRG